MSRAGHTALPAAGAPSVHRDEQLRILAAAHDDPLYVLFRLAHASGLRQSQLVGLQWPDLDLVKGSVRAART
jgi:integrase